MTTLINEQHGFQWRIVIDGQPNSGHWIDVADGDFQNLSVVGRLEFRAKPKPTDEVTATLTAQQEGFLSLMRIIAVLVARTGKTTLEIGENEFMELPDVPPLSTWKNQAAFTHFVRVDLTPETVECIRRHALGLHVEREDIMDAEIVDEPRAIEGGIVTTAIVNRVLQRSWDANTGTVG